MASTSNPRPTADAAIAWLAEERRRPSRRSAQTVEYGDFLLEGGHINKLGDDVWAFLEQVSIAALDVGRWDLAELCVRRLSVRFPGSARVAALEGMILEAQGELEKALHLYDSLLAKDETDIVITKRRIAVIKSMPSSHRRGGPERAIEALIQHLDSYYTDPEGWQELAALYTELRMYHQASFALEELQLLVPHNSFHVLQLAETAYTIGDLTRAYRAYLRVLEMCEAPPSEGTKAGPWTRALWGLKLTTAKLLADPASQKASTADDVTPPPAKLEAIDALVTDLLLNRAYAGSSQGVKKARDAVRKLVAGMA